MIGLPDDGCMTMAVLSYESSPRSQTRETAERRPDTGQASVDKTEKPRIAGIRRSRYGDTVETEAAATEMVSEAERREGLPC